jgi:hypothetical protein
MEWGIHAITAVRNSRAMGITANIFPTTRKPPVALDVQKLLLVEAMGVIG